MPEVAVVSAVRTAVGTARKGSLANTVPEKMAATVLQASIERSGVDPREVDDVVLGESLYGGGDVARFAAEEIGLIQAGGAAVNRHCASGLTAVGFAAGSIASGMERFVIGGGVHSASFMPRSSQREPGSADLHGLTPFIDFGASPRASIALFQAARAHAFLRRRGYVSPEDVKAVAPDVLRHRVILSYEAEAEGKTVEEIVRVILEHVHVP